MTRREPTIGRLEHALPMGEGVELRLKKGLRRNFL